MFRAFRKNIRMHEKYDDNATYTNLATYIEREYANIEDIGELVADAVDTIELLEIVGLKITNISKDGYNWSTINAELSDIKKLEKLLQNVPNLFYQYSVIALRNNKDTETYEFDFASPEDGFVRKPLPMFKINLYPGSETIYKGDKGYYQVKDNAIVQEDVKDLFGMCENPWDSSAVSYYIQYIDGVHKCSMNIIVYDGVEIEVYGYGDSPEKALANVRDVYETLKEEAMDNGYQA